MKNNTTSRCILLLFIPVLLSKILLAQSVNVPYSLPAPGQAVAIGTNTADNVRPSDYASTYWSYSLFNSYGTGAFVPDYSSAGAFVISGSGGHKSPPVVDAVIFDFADATWKRKANANGVSLRVTDYDVSETTGSPYFEIKGTQVPSPAHLYQSTGYIPSALGGGLQGSYLMMGSAYVTPEPYTGGGIHRMDLSTGLWSRVTNDVLEYGYSAVATAVFDPQTKRFYFIHAVLHVETSVQYLDANDWRIKRTPSFPYPADWAGPSYQTAFLDPVRRLLITQRIGFPLRALDLNNFAQGWVTLKMSGTQPSEYENRWAFYEPDGCFYTKGNSGQVLTRLTPPAGDWKTGTWTYSNVTLGGVALPDYTTVKGNNDAHYGTFFYVPAIQSLAWIAGENSKVTIMKPPLNVTNVKNNNEENMTFAAYPNPFSGITRIELPSPFDHKNATLQVLNIQGKLVTDLTSSLAEKSVEFNGSTLHDGTYIIQLKTGTKTYSAKIILSK